MTPDERNSFKKWLKGIPYEISFWKSYYSHHRSLKALDSWSDYGKECRLDDFDIIEFAASCSSTPLFIDLGCALSYTFGTEFRGIPVRVDRVDPLASFYNRILERHAPEKPRIRFGMLESVSVAYKEGSVDLIHVRNALDHSANPTLGIMECLKCLRVGGVLYLNHHHNEALRENYRGFHQYNVDIDGDKLVIWNNDNRYDINEMLSGIATVRCNVAANGHIVGIITKNADLDSDSTPDTEARMSEMLVMTLETINSFSFALKYKAAMIVASIAHPVMRRIPRNLVDKLKHSLRKKRTA